MPLTGLQLSLELRDEALARVLKHNAEWAEAAGQLFALSFTPGEEITGEDIRARLTQAGLPEPKHHNGWGALTRKLAVAGRLHDTGMARKSKLPRSHAARIVLWRVMQ